MLHFGLEFKSSTLTFLYLSAKVYGQENPCFINIKYGMVGIFCLANIK